MQESGPVSQRRTTIIAGLGLAIACVACFGRVIGFDFVDVDDPLHLIRNEAWRGLGAEQLRWMFLEHHGSAGYDPIAWLSYAVDYEIHGLDPAGFHATGLVLYILCIWAVYGLIRRVLSAATSGDAAPPPARLSRAARPLPGTAPERRSSRSPRPRPGTTGATRSCCP